MRLQQFRVSHRRRPILTDDGEWARLIRIDHSLLITELLRADAFTGADPALLAAVMSSIAHDDDRPGRLPAHQFRAGFLAGHRFENWLSRSRPMKILRSYGPTLPRLTERWIGDPTLTWIGLCKRPRWPKGDIYRLLHEPWNFCHNCTRSRPRTPALADTASQAIAVLRRGVLEELP